MLFATQSMAADALEPERGAHLSFVLAAVLVVSCSRPRRWRFTSRSLTLAGIGAGAGLASFGCWVEAVARLGTRLGLELERSPLRGVDPVGALSIVIAAPVFEELLYRQQLLEAVRTRAGSAVGVLASAAAFAATHAWPWQALCTFAVGLLLGVVWRATGSVSLCIGYHAGLNLAGVLVASHPDLLYRAATPGGVMGVAILATGIALARSPSGRVPLPLETTR